MGHFSYQQPEKDQLADQVFALRSDHVRFWYFQQQLDDKVTPVLIITMAMQRNDNICQSKDVLSQFSFPALLVTDTAYLRGHMRECYHQACDRLNNTSLGQENMDFLSSLTAALARALLELSSGRPSLASEEPEPSVAANTLGLGGRRQEGGERRNINYENVHTQINIENLHLTIAGPAGAGLQGEEEAGYLYIDPAMAKVKQIIKQFYNEEDGGDSLNSPMIIKLKNDL